MQFSLFLRINELFLLCLFNSIKRVSIAALRRDSSRDSTVKLHSEVNWFASKRVIKSTHRQPWWMLKGNMQGIFLSWIVSGIRSWWCEIIIIIIIFKWKWLLPSKKRWVVNLLEYSVIFDCGYLWWYFCNFLENYKWHIFTFDAIWLWKVLPL